LYATTTPEQLTVSTARGVLANDRDSRGYGLTVDQLNENGDVPPFVGTSTDGAAVTVNVDGSFTYDPTTSGRLQALAAGHVAVDRFSYQATDGHGITGAATVTVLILGVHDPPALSAIEPGTLHYAAGSPAAPVTSSLLLADAKSPTLAGATVSISSGFEPSEDSLAIAGQNGITGNFDSSTGVLTLSGTASLAAYQTALRSVTYANDNSFSPTGARTISFQVDDGQRANSQSNVVSRTIEIAQASSLGGYDVLPYAIEQSQAVFNNQLIEIGVNKGTVKQALVCDGSGAANATSTSEMQQLQENGCPLTQRNNGSSCPAVALSPPSCLWEFTGVDEGQGFDVGHEIRFQNGLTGGVQCTNPYPIPTNNYAQYAANHTITPGDPRVITIYVVPDGSLSASGGLIPIVGYAEVYLAGWDHDPCINRTDPDSPDGQHVGRVWGYIMAIDTTSPG
jgi:VCBS repeat-containing protein